jgi:hypothetical protein
MISEEALTSALVKELCSGRALKEAMQNRREIEASAEARAMKDAKSSIGKPIGSIPQHEYFLLANKYGIECWDDREFVRDFFKSQTHLRAGHI